MKPWLYTFCLLSLLAACTEISYKEPQPKGIRVLPEIPRKLQGRYLIEENNEPVDTLYVEKFGYRLGKDEVASLSDSLVLKQYKGYYFLSSRNNYAWYLRILRIQKNGDLVFMEMKAFPRDDESISAYISELETVVPVVITEVDNETYYIIDPQPKQLLELIRKGFFKEVVFKRM